MLDIARGKSDFPLRKNYATKRYVHYSFYMQYKNRLRLIGSGHLCSVLVFYYALVSMTPVINNGPSRNVNMTVEEGYLLLDLKWKFRIYNFGCDYDMISVNEYYFRFMGKVFTPEKQIPRHSIVAIAASTVDPPRGTKIWVAIFERRPSSLAIEVKRNHALEESKFPDTVGLPQCFRTGA